ncbi:DUF3667 domain-containing protein [Polaribacter glomeratus]|nr:DUF3667 domain-containing protein [Polaribacter glomeratus]
MIKLKKTKNKVTVVKDAACLNCGHPFNGQEKFCPDCGQANKGNEITFKSFIHEVFNGLFNFDAKFWTTIIPLLINPGKVSRDYVAGKRQRYTNPFRFYLTVSILFFLLIGLYNTKVKYESLAQESKTEIVDLIKEETSKTKEALTDKKIDSIKKKLNEKMKSSFIPVPEKVRKNILAEVEKEARDTTENKMNSSIINFNVGEGDSKLDKFVNYQKKYPNSSIDVALDSLEFEKNFTNRFIYTRAKAANSFTNDEESRDQFLNQILSFGSISLFVLLPIFTLFLKLFYIRRKYTYVDHLIFVFHIQTVFFMLFSIFYLLKIVGISPQLWVFVTLFLLYLIIAMKQFYQQGYFKTFVKFLLLNLSYTIVASIGVVFVLLISFALF